MPQIMPISALRNETNKIVDLCHEGEPVFVTRNGQGELVVMSQALYEQMQARLDLYQKLEEAESQFASGAATTKHKALMTHFKKKLEKK